MRPVTIPELDAPPLERYGFPDWDAFTTPAAGASFTHTCDGRYYTRFVSIRAKLVTDANVASRQLVCEYLDPSDRIFMTHGGALTVAASTTVYFYFQTMTDTAEWEVNSSVIVPLTPVLLPPTFKLKLNLVNVQAGDQLSQVYAVRERFYSDAPLR